MINLCHITIYVYQYPKKTFIKPRSVGTVCPRLYMQALRKPSETDVGITVPRVCVETLTPSLVSIIEVSQASHIQVEDITPRYFQYVLERITPVRMRK